MLHPHSYASVYISALQVLRMLLSKLFTTQVTYSAYASIGGIAVQHIFHFWNEMQTSYANNYIRMS